MCVWNSVLMTGTASLATLCALSSTGCSTAEFVAERPERSELVPEVRLLGAGRHPTTVAELSRGRPALISLWATWCESCAREFDSLNRLERRLGDSALVIGIAQGEPYDHVTAFVEQMGITYPQLIDEQFSFSDAAGTRSLPAVLVADRDGVVRHSGGELDRVALDALRIALATPSHEGSERLAAGR
jgi:thiol-disulfide isomerase/thioredoxin